MSEDESTKEMLSKTASKISTFAIGNYIQPIRILKDSLENHDWFKGLILSATFLEMFGFLSLRIYYEQKIDRKHHKEIGNFLNRLGLSRTIKLLYFNGFIKHNTFLKMTKIIKARNKLVHPIQKMGKDFVFAEGSDHIPIETVEKMIEDAIGCLKELGVNY
jgi:hypothetical protein